MSIAAHAALGWAYFYTFSQGPAPDHDAAAEYIPRGWAELNSGNPGSGETSSVSEDWAE
jgi:hypothetical protein